MSSVGALVSSANWDKEMTTHGTRHAYCELSIPENWAAKCQAFAAVDHTAER